MLSDCARRSLMELEPGEDVPPQKCRAWAARRHAYSGPPNRSLRCPLRLRSPVSAGRSVQALDSPLSNPASSLRAMIIRTKQPVSATWLTGRAVVGAVPQTDAAWFRDAKTHPAPFHTVSSGLREPPHMRRDRVLGRPRRHPTPLRQCPRDALQRSIPVGTNRRSSYASPVISGYCIGSAPGGWLKAKPLGVGAQETTGSNSLPLALASAMNSTLAAIWCGV
jgi:hypothetical protein